MHLIWRVREDIGEPSPQDHTWPVEQLQPVFEELRSQRSHGPSWSVDRFYPMVPFLPQHVWVNMSQNVPQHHYLLSGGAATKMVTVIREVQACQSLWPARTRKKNSLKAMLEATTHASASLTVNDLWEGVCLPLRSFAFHPEMSASSSRYHSQRLQ